MIQKQNKFLSKENSIQETPNTKQVAWDMFELFICREK